MSLRRSISTRVALSLIFVSLLASSAFSHLPLPPKKGEAGRRVVQTQVSDFTLVDQDGKSFWFASTRGKVVLVNFVLVTCPDVCPLLTAKFAAIQRALQERKQNDYRLLSITTDPERDTPAEFKSYADNFKADYRHWLFLTGPGEKLAKVWKDFGITVKKSSSGQVQHTSLTTIIDRRGIRRVDYYGDKWQEKDLLNDFFALESQKNP